MQVERQHDLQSEVSRRQVKKLLEIRHAITSTLSLYDKDIESIRDARCVQGSDVIEFANNIALALRAPKLWVRPFPLVGAAPPAPQAEQMRAGVLANYNKKNLEEQLQQQAEITEAVTRDRAASIADREPPAPTLQTRQSSADSEVSSVRKRKAGSMDEGSAPALPQKKRQNISFGLDSDSEEDD
jgi:hypothetical protein